ncbi:MAG TPA: ATP-binding protein [Noviherbaspirillum sp.]|nr:ATP-binding protein [Noviherbaspirillum sp.]
MSDDPIAAPQPDPALCAQEPIRIPGAIQPHGFLLALHPSEHTIVQLSANAGRFLGRQAGDLIGARLATAVGQDNEADLLDALCRASGRQPYYLGVVRLESGPFDVLGHHHDALLVLEFEPAARAVSADFRLLYPLLGSFLGTLTANDSIMTMSEHAAQAIKGATGFGRVLVYRFDECGHGIVLAEARDDGYHSYLNQRFPASDIPLQARELYLANRIRLIPNADYEPAPLIPADNALTGAPTDLSYAALRSVSPIHLQYMRNMGTLASMSVSLVVKGRLWGLISCHHAHPRHVPFEVRTGCEQLAQILALRIESCEERAQAHHRLELRSLLVAMLAGLTRGPDFIDNITAISPQLLRFASASGAAVVFEQRVVRFGDAPPEADIHKIVEWLAARPHDEAFHTDALAQLMPEAASMARHASGILALPISSLHRHYLIWFRPEIVHTIDWAGNPHLKDEAGAVPSAVLTPRASFDSWRETVRGRSAAWRPSEIECANEFRAALLGVVLERAEQMAELAEELGRANKELESFSYSVSHDLRAPLRHIAGYSDLLLELEEGQLSERGQRYVRNIKDSARFAGKLVDDLLSFSQMGRASLRPGTVDLNELVASCIEHLADEAKGRELHWEVSPLPIVQADPRFLLLALRNLLSNAVKYTRPKPQARISISAHSSDEETVVQVRDNGVGFNTEYKHKLFGVFQRLHRYEEFEGTGIGLANVQRIVERHGGRVWADSVIGEGAVFTFSLPKQLPTD